METLTMTGASGFIGRVLADRLVTDGYELRLLARTPSKVESFETRGTAVVEGDLTDPEAVREAVSGSDAVVHLAAVYRLGGDLDWMRAVNVEGTRNVLDAAREEGVSRVLYCGSDTSLGNTQGRVADESKEHDGNYRSNYARTKHEAHQLVEERMHEGEPIVHAIVSSVYGPGDESPVAELIESHLAGHALAYLDRDAGYTFTHVEDVASGLQRALEEGATGESYLISGEPATFEEFFEVLSERTGIPEPRFGVPDWLVDAVKPVAKAGASLLGKTASEIEEMIGMGRNVTRFFSGEKAREELGWSARSLRKGLEDTLPSFRERERESRRSVLEAARYPLLGLALFDVALGATATFAPELYSTILHGSAETVDSSGALLPRTGTLWLVFAGVQGVAALDPVDRPSWVLAAGVLRLMDVPADPVYYLNADQLTPLGTAGLLSAPVFNLLTGAFFAYAGYRELRSLR